MPKIPVTFDDVKTLAERNKVKMLNDSDMFGVEVAQEIKGLTKEDALETLGINDLDGRVQYLEETGGPPGPQGDDGLSAYEVAVEEGFEGDETAWLASLKGADGDDGLSAYEVAVEEGFDGDETAWLASLKGADGDEGLSAYEVAVEEGFEGDETAWLASLKGADGEEGKSAYDIYVETTSDSPVKTEEQWLASLKGADGDDGLSAYEVAVEEGFEGDETAWLASLKGADGDEGKSAYDIYVETTSDSPVKTEEQWLASLKGADGDEGKSAYDIYVETTSDSPVKTEEQWLASLKGADGKSAYEYAEEEGYEGTEGEFAEALADVENKIDKSKIVTAWNSPKDDEVPSALLVYNSLDGGGGGEGVKWRKGVVVIGSASQDSEELADLSWEEITVDNEEWGFFWHGIRIYGVSVRFLKGEYEIPTNIYYGQNDDGRFAIPCGGVAKIEGAGEDTVIKVGYPAGGTAFLSATNYHGSNSAPCHISNLKIVNTGTTALGVVAVGEDSSGSVVENVIVEDMIGAGILASWNVKNVTFRNCTTINCGSAFAGEQAVGIGVTSVDNWTPSNIVIDGCTVIGGAYAGIGIVNAEDCKVVNCHVEDYGAIGAGAIGGKRNIFANNTIIRDTQADPQAGEFGILLNETDRAIVTGNIVENGHIMDNDSNDCLVENNIGDVLNNDRGLLNPTNGKFYDYTIGVSGADGALIPEFIFTEVE